MKKGLLSISLAMAALLLAPMAQAAQNSVTLPNNQQGEDNEENFDIAVKQGKQELKQDKDAQEIADKIDNGEVEQAGQGDGEHEAEDVNEPVELPEQESSDSTVNEAEQSTTDDQNNGTGTAGAPDSNTEGININD